MPAARSPCSAGAPSASARTRTSPSRTSPSRASPGRRPHEPDHPYGMDIPAILAAADDLAARIERHGLDDLPPADLTPPAASSPA